MDVAALVSREVWSWLRKRAERMEIPFALRIESAMDGKRSSGWLGRKARGREWMASCTSLGVRRKGNHGESPTGKDLLNRAERASK